VVEELVGVPGKAQSGAADIRRCEDSFKSKNAGKTLKTQALSNVPLKLVNIETRGIRISVLHGVSADLV
jgi:hypothetical protein